MIRKQNEMNKKVVNQCHGGVGELACEHILIPDDSKLGIKFMHHDIISVGASIGEHVHDGSEEVYYIIKGQGTMIMDGENTLVGQGDVSIVLSGHSHGIVNSGNEPLVVIVVCI